MKGVTRRPSIIDLSARGFYSVLAILTLLFGGLIFLAYGWYPYVLRTSRLHLQAVVDDLCSYYARFLPLDPSNRHLGQLLIDPEYVIQTQEIAGETQIPATLVSMQRLVNLGNLEFEVSVVEPDPSDVGPGPRETVTFRNFTVNFTPITGSDSVDFFIGEDPEPPQILSNPPGLDRLFHDGNTLICTGQITLNRGLFTFLLPWVRNPQVITAVAGVTRVPHNSSGFNGGVLLLLENAALVTQQNRQQVLARNSFAASLAHFISRSGVFRDRFRVAVVDPGSLSQGQINAHIIKDVGQSGLVPQYQGGDCDDADLISAIGNTSQGDPQMIVSNFLNQILGLNFFASVNGTQSVDCDTIQSTNLAYSIMTLGFQDNRLNDLPRIDNGFLNFQDGNNGIVDPIIVYIGFNFPNDGFITALLQSTNSPVHIVIFPATIIDQSGLQTISTRLQTLSSQTNAGEGFGFRQDSQIFSFQSLINRRLRFTLTIFDACSALDFGANQPLPVNLELNFNADQNLNQADCRQDPTIVFPNQDINNTNMEYFELLINSTGTRQTNFQNALNNEASDPAPQLDQLFQNWPQDQPLLFPYAYRFYATRLFLREEYGWMY